MIVVVGRQIGFKSVSILFQGTRRFKKKNYNFNLFPIVNCNFKSFTISKWIFCWHLQFRPSFFILLSFHSVWRPLVFVLLFSNLAAFYFFRIPLFNVAPLFMFLATSLGAFCIYFIIFKFSRLLFFFESCFSMWRPFLCFWRHLLAPLVNISFSHVCLVLVCVFVCCWISSIFLFYFYFYICKFYMQISLLFLTLALLLLLMLFRDAVADVIGLRLLAKLITITFPTSTIILKNKN